MSGVTAVQVRPPSLVWPADPDVTRPVQARGSTGVAPPAQACRSTRSEPEVVTTLRDVIWLAPIPVDPLRSTPPV